MDTSQQATVGSRDREGSVAGQRQRRSIAEKRRIVEETLTPGASVARVARAHGVNANQVFGWRRKAAGQGGDGGWGVLVRALGRAGFCQTQSFSHVDRNASRPPPGGRFFVRDEQVWTPEPPPKPSLDGAPLG